MNDSELRELRTLKEKCEQLEQEKTEWVDMVHSVCDTRDREREEKFNAWDKINAVRLLHKPVELSNGMFVCSICCMSGTSRSYACHDHDHGPNKPLCATIAVINAI